VSRRPTGLLHLHLVAALLAVLLLVAAGEAAEHLRVTAAKASLYSRPSADSFTLLTLEKGAELELADKAGDWYSVRVVSSTAKGSAGVKGYISRSDVETVVGPAEEPKPTPAPAPRPTLRAAPAAAPPARPAAPPPGAEPAPEPTPRPKPVAPVPPPVPAATPTPASSTRTRIVLLLNGGAIPTKLDYSESRSFTDFAEEGSLDIDSAYKTGFGGEIGLRYFFTKHVGAEAVFSVLSRNGSAQFSGRFPHPLYLSRPRLASGTADDLSDKENTVHVNLVYGGGQGSLGYAVFAGVSFFVKVETQLIGQPQYSHAFPFDSITITSVPVLAPSKSVVGFNVGGEVEYRFSDRVGAALSARFSRAAVELEVDAANQVKVEAGGLFAGLGIRVRF
jgi:hypothetical protein